MGSSGDFTYIAPVKSTPVTVNGGESLVRIAGSGGGSGILYGWLVILRHVTQRTVNDLLYKLSGGWYPVLLTKTCQGRVLARVKSVTMCFFYNQLCEVVVLWEKNWKFR